MLKPLLTFLLLLSIASLGYAQDDQRQYMSVHSERIKVNDSLCYQVKTGYTNLPPWKPFCGKFSNLCYEEGYEYFLQVKEYDPHADTIFVTKTIAREYKKGQYIRVLKERIMVNDSLCYQVKPCFDRRPKDWEPFCGEFDKVCFEDYDFYHDYYKFVVKEYNPQANTMFVMRCCIRYSWLEEAKKQVKLKEKRELYKRKKAEERNDTVLAIPMPDSK